MVPIYDARRDLEDGRTASDRFGESTAVITTTTVKDYHLRALTWKDELEIVRAYQPDYHIPTEYSVYEDTMGAAEQEKAIRDCMEGTEWMARKLAGEHTQVLVQAKGWEKWHFEICLQTLRKLRRQTIVFYGSGYAGPGVGNQLHRLLRDTRRAINVMGAEKVLLIGRQSPRELSKFPPQVVAAAGLRWFRELSDDAGEVTEEQYRMFDQQVRSRLGGGQAMLNQFMYTGVQTDG
jgi:hypothetical protein